MLTFLIPTAKELNQPKTAQAGHLPKGMPAVLHTLAAQSPAQLATALKLTPQAAQAELARFQAIKQEKACVSPAFELFNGLMYRSLGRDSLTAGQLNYLTQQVFITSALYGIIPFDYPIAPYRLDFHSSINITGKSLKLYWRPFYDRFAHDHANAPIISLLSSEFTQVFSKGGQENWLQIAFKEETAGQLKTHSTISKKARGAFLQACAKANCQTPEDLKNLNFDGFHWQAELSTAQLFTYVKKNCPADH
ncbi:peroxide stress protein YaaA [Streptococcus halichoeri]|uniref:peroxide stress protein YaaA n=1 Tax=Streptococcus halichoeri TaxID=254785 RepID=UPI001357E316|nr:peroxide stress protein YaaA [Streptococcus halichoeri]